MLLMPLADATGVADENDGETELSKMNVAVTPDPEDYHDEANLLDVLIEEKHRFRSSFICGDATLDLFLDKKNPCNKMIHPALPGEIEKKKEENRKRGELPFSNHTDRSL